MFSIVDNLIKLTKGDSAAIEVELLNEDDTPFEMEDGDKLYFTVRKRIGSPVMLQVTSTSNILDILPADSKKLDIGSCVYDIQLSISTGDVFTIVGVEDTTSVNMIVMPEITEE